MAPVTAETSACRLCPPGGGTVVARYPGDAPAAKASARAHQEAQATGLPHHDHYDPALDAFVVVRHDAADGAAAPVAEIPGQPGAPGEDAVSEAA